MSESESLPPKKKRQRRDSDENQRARSQYWFKDGNVVLHAENTLFRVHKSILSRHSQIFEDTFAMPQAPSQEDESIEGCPVIPLSDTAKDLGNVISLLYDNDKALKYGNKLPATVLGSMLRLGRKYVIAHLEKEALDRLHHDYPTTLEDWDLLNDDDDSRQIEDSSLVDPKTEIISIAHEFQLFTILPAAYAQYLKWQLLENLPGDNSIPEDARKRCIIGHARILAFIKDRIVDALNPPLVLPSKACSSGKCEVDSWKTIKNLPVWSIVESETYGIFDCDIGVTENTCSRCRSEVKKLTQTVRSEFWTALPIFFGLPAWADLKDDP